MQCNLDISTAEIITVQGSFSNNAGTVTHCNQTHKHTHIPSTHKSS